MSGQRGITAIWGRQKKRARLEADFLGLANVCQKLEKFFSKIRQTSKRDCFIFTSRRKQFSEGFFLNLSNFAETLSVDQSDFDLH
jgi:hypothetical protein